MSKPQYCRKLTQELSHFRCFDERFACPLAWNVDPKLSLHERHTQGIQNIARQLKQKGAGQMCWVISEDSDVDGKELEVQDALEHAVGRDMGTILSCIAGRLAVYVGEDETLLLAK